MAKTLVTFHAHPDDAELSCAGTMAQAKKNGHRVVLVIATRGELGETPPGSVAAGRTLADTRVEETTAGAAILGVDRVEFLGYLDSGMADEPTNTAPGSFAAADVEEAAERLARILDEEHADVLTVYDDHGQYGHPDHIQVHRVGVRAAEKAGTSRVYEATMNRDHILKLMGENTDALESVEAEDRPTTDEIAKIGSPGHVITTTVDVRDYAELKRRALTEHRSQVGSESFFLAMPDDAWRESFGYEWFIRRGVPSTYRESSLFDE